MRHGPKRQPDERNPLLKQAGALVGRRRPDLGLDVRPLRFDYAVPLTKGKDDVVQEFRFGGGTSF